MVDAADDRFAIIATLDRYAECLDTRDWARLGQVFAGDAVMDYGMAAAQGVDEIRAGISSFLAGADPASIYWGTTESNSVVRLPAANATVGSCIWAKASTRVRPMKPGSNIEMN